MRCLMVFNNGSIPPEEYIDDDSKCHCGEITSIRIPTKLIYKNEGYILIKPVCSNCLRVLFIKQKERHT